MKTAIVLSYKPIDNDSRVQNQINSLKDFKMNVKVIYLPKIVINDITPFSFLNIKFIENIFKFNKRKIIFLKWIKKIIFPKRIKKIIFPKWIKKIIFLKWIKK